MENDLAIYLLVRTDLPSMNSGKGMAQANHSGVQIAVKWAKDPLFKEYIALGNKNGADNFNTTITLGASEIQIGKCLVKASEMKNSSVIYNPLYDPTYPFVVDAEIAGLISVKATKVGPIENNKKVLFEREELTCAYFLGNRNDPQFRAIFEGLELHP